MYLGAVRTGFSRVGFGKSVTRQSSGSLLKLKVNIFLFVLISVFERYFSISRISNQYIQHFIHEPMLSTVSPFLLPVPDYSEKQYWL